MSYRTQYNTQIGLGGRITSGVKWLIIANVAVFVVQVVADMFRPGLVEEVFALDGRDILDHLAVWQPLTYMFLHSTNWLAHLLLNMLMLWMFGTEVERRWGMNAFLRYYFVCGIGAGVITFMIFPNSRTIGASGAVFGVMLAYAMLFPNRQILFWFIFPMRAVSFVLLCAGIELFALRGLDDGVAHLAHLGGMLVGYLYLKRAWRLGELVREIRWRLRRRRFRVMKDDENYPYH